MVLNEIYRGYHFTGVKFSIFLLIFAWALQQLNVYRATRIHSADYAVARCLSVCLSHFSILSKWLYVSSKFFSPSGSPTILVLCLGNGAR